MAYSTDIKDYYRRAWGLGDRVPFKHGGTWADWKVNYEDQMSFEEYLQDDNIVKTIQAVDKAEGGRIGFADGPPGTRSYVINPKNVDLEFKPDPKKVKLYKKATWDKIYQYKEAIEKLIKDFEKTKILPNEKFEITTDKIAKLLNLKKGLDQVWDIDIWKGDHEEGSKSYMESGEVIKKSKIKEK